MSKVAKVELEITPIDSSKNVKLTNLQILTCVEEAKTTVAPTTSVHLQTTARTIAVQTSALLYSFIFLYIKIFVK